MRKSLRRTAVPKIIIIMRKYFQSFFIKAINSAQSNIIFFKLFFNYSVITLRTLLFPRAFFICYLDSIIFFAPIGVFTKHNSCYVYFFESSLPSADSNSICKRWLWHKQISSQGELLPKHCPSLTLMRQMQNSS